MTERAEQAQHARFRLDDVIHSPIRFSIVAALAKVDSAEFSAVRDTVQVSDSVLSKQVTLLEQAGYVDVKKGYVGKRPRTWLALSPAGEQAFQAHLAALRAIAEGWQAPTQRTP
ncbi:MAG: transcriptional regulator [Actinomycetales bacterium]|jgi:DNA-binding MarR family transcriptional regulator|nr:transcriptional regulator [Candidatus Phosphoribacter baldrii]HRC12532.1 transcriptional regulator [Dermatophilaceae bacterium]